MPDTRERVQTDEAYDRMAGIYDLVFDPFIAAGRRRAVERMACGAGDRVLEVGVGTGSTSALYPPGVRVVGIDLSRGMLRRARERLGDERGRFLARMDAQRLGFATESFDKVVAFHIVSVVPDPIRLVDEMRRVCKPEGDIVIVNHFHSSNPLVGAVERLLEPLTRRIGWKTTLGLDELVRRSGLDVVGIERVNLFGYWHLVHARKEGTRGRAAGIA